MQSKTSPDVARRAPSQASVSARRRRESIPWDGGALTVLARLANVALMLFIAIEAMVKIGAKRADLAAQGESALGLYLVVLLFTALFLSPHILALAGLAKTGSRQTTSRALIYNSIALAAALLVAVVTQDRQSIIRGDWLILLPWLMVFGVNIFLLYKRGAQFALDGRIIVDVSCSPSLDNLISNALVDRNEIADEIADKMDDM
jgi:hypothetical protein